MQFQERYNNVVEEKKDELIESQEKNKKMEDPSFRPKIKTALKPGWKTKPSQIQFKYQILFPEYNPLIGDTSSQVCFRRPNTSANRGG